MARTVPSVSMQQTGNLVSAELWDNGIKTVNDFLSNRPAFKAISSVGQAVSNNTWSAVQYNQGHLDTDAGHSSVTNNTRYTCQVAGMYWVKGSAGWQLNAAGACRIDPCVAKNGATWSGAGSFMVRPSGDYALFSTSALVRMNVGDYVEIWVRQESGVTLSLDGGTSLMPPDFSVIWIAK